MANPTPSLLLLPPVNLPESLPPASASLPVSVPAVPEEPQVSVFPLSWIFSNGSPSVLYRSIRDVSMYAGPSDGSWERIAYSSRQAWDLLLHQKPDGTWGHGMLSAPVLSSGAGGGVGAILGYRRLLELGWAPDSGPLSMTRRLLFRLLAEDSDPEYLFEMRQDAGDDIDLIRRGRQILREAAAAALAQAGYESDPRLRGAARRILDKMGAFLRSPLAEKPFIRVGNQHVLPLEAAPPTFHSLVMLAWMPSFRSEFHDLMERLYTFISQPLPRMVPVQQVGPNHLIEQTNLVLGDILPTRHIMDGDMPTALAWLEVMARLGFLNRNEGWVKLVDKLLDDRNRHGVWRPPRSVTLPETVPDWVWPVLPLSDDPADTTSVYADVTFRLGLIARLSGRSLETI